jgi:hypothetical protein
MQSNRERLNRGIFGNDQRYWAEEVARNKYHNKLIIFANIRRIIIFIIRETPNSSYKLSNIFFPHP